MCRRVGVFGGEDEVASICSFWIGQTHHTVRVGGFDTAERSKEE